MLGRKDLRGATTIMVFVVGRMKVVCASRRDGRGGNGDTKQSVYSLLTPVYRPHVCQ